MTWGTAYLATLGDPTGLPAFLPQPKLFAAQTVRQAVRLRSGGTRARLALSNEFGHEPLVIDEVAVTGGVRVRHAGKTAWEIPPGKTALSDQFPLSVPAGGELVVDCFVAGTARASAFLPAVQRTGEAAPGNQAGAARLDGADPFTAGYWITRVLTDASRGPGPVIITLGDSITRGDGTSADSDQRYPDHLQRRLPARTGAVVLNAGISGNRVLRPGFGPAMTARLARDVLAVPEATHVIIMGGLNDLGGSAVFGGPRPTAGELAAGLLSLARRAAGSGLRPVLGTITPLLSSSYESFRAEGNDEIRRAVNDALRAQRDWPVADFASAVAADGDGRLSAAFDCGDGIHLNDAGAGALAHAVDLALFA